MRIRVVTYTLPVAWPCKTQIRRRASVLLIAMTLIPLGQTIFNTIEAVTSLQIKSDVRRLPEEPGPGCR